MVGTPKKSVGSPASSSEAVSAASNRRRRSTVAPAARAQWSPTTRPWVWKRGRVSSNASAGSQAQAARRPVTVASTLSWLISAPLLFPVVPEV